jgi:hypothetical protein
MASWDRPPGNLSLMLRFQGADLVAEVVTVFRDGSGRENFRSSFLLRAKK